MSTRAWAFLLMMVGGGATLALSRLGYGWALLGLTVVSVGAGALAARSMRRLVGQARRAAVRGTVTGVRRSPVREIAEIAAAVDAAADGLSQQQKEARSQLGGMETLLDAMSEGVVELSADGYLVRANRAALRILELHEPKLPLPLQASVREAALREALKEAVARPFDPVEVTPWDRTIVVLAHSLTGEVPS